MRRRTLLLAGTLVLALACSDGPTSPLPQPEPPPKPQPPATGFVAPSANPDTVVVVHR